MFILKGQDLSMKANKLYFNYNDYSNDEDCYESEIVENYDRLIDLNTSSNYEDLNLYINDNDFSFIITYENDIMIIEANDLTKKDILNDKILFNDKDIETINNDENADLPIRCKNITFTEFKKMFNLKGTKKQFIKSCPNGFNLTEYKNYVLSKDVRNGKEIFCYECILGSVKE